MTIEERFERIETNILRLAATQEKMVDLMGLTVDAQRHFAADLAESRQRLLLLEKMLAAFATKVDQMGDQVKTMVSILEGTIRRTYVQ